jgi:outer membrane protein assembly factor BamD (BamD/ComL family)
MMRTWCLVAFTAWVVSACSETVPESQTSGKAAGASEVTQPVVTRSGEAGLYASAQEAEQQGRAVEAVGLYRRILAEYPQSADNYKAAFLIGFVFSEKLNLPDSARVWFQAVIRDYPNCEFVDDAQAMLRFLDGELPPFEEAPHS